MFTSDPLRTPSEVAVGDCSAESSRLMTRMMKLSPDTPLTPLEGTHQRLDELGPQFQLLEALVEAMLGRCRSKTGMGRI